MGKDTDVFADNTVSENENLSERQSEKNKYAPGDKVFKEKDRSKPPGYTSVPGAGPNPNPDKK
jgi:hypothetical protein